MHAAAQLLFGECGKPSFDEIKPTGRSGREVQVEAGPLDQPIPDHGGLVSAVVVQDQMNIQFGWQVGFDGVEEAAKFFGTMALLGLSNHLTRPGIQGSEQTGCAVTNVVMRPTLDLSRAHGEQRRSAIQRLNLTLFVDAQNQGAIWRSQVQADDVTYFFDKQRVFG